METKKLLKWIGIGLAVFIIPIIIVVCNLTGKCETPPPTCSWQDDACGQFPCSPTQRHQTCGPVDCTGGTCTAGQTQCVADTSCVLPTSIQIHFIDVGQGDSILIDSGTNEVLIDGGQNTDYISQYIREYIDGSLEVMVATHPHFDHVGGLSKVLNDFQVKEIWLNRDVSNKDKDFYQKFMTAVEAEKSTGATVNYAKRNDIISTGNLNFSILNPLDTLFGEINNNSIVLRMKYGNITFLFTGDAEQKAEASMLTTGSELQAQILKAGHHCSRTSSSKPFLEKVKPERAICMVGENNRYGHPHQETLTALEEIGAEIYRTDTDGTIIVLTDGIDYKIETSK